MMIMLVVLVLLVLVTVSANTIIDSTSSSSSDLNNWPIVGLFAQPTQKQDKACGGNCQYIAASYVKYLGNYNFYYCNYYHYNYYY